MNTIIITLLCDPGRYNLQYCGDIHNLGTGDHSLLISLFHATWRLGPSVPASWPGTSCTDGNYNSSFASLHRQNLDVMGSYSSYSSTGLQVAPRLTDINLACELNPPTNVCRLHVVMLPLDSSHHYTIAASHSDDSHLFVFTDLTN